MGNKAAGILILSGVVIALILFLFSRRLKEKRDAADYLSGIEMRRSEIDNFFLNSDKSPLTEVQKMIFNGLSYFPVNKKYRVRARFNKNPKEQIVKINITDGSLEEYFVYGWAEFSLDGKDLKLTIYKPVNDDSGYFFIPFYDETSAETTYGGGRYVEPEVVNNKTIIIDFNLAYNPYCAYNHNYHCPIPPRENNLKVPVLAGEKIPEFVHQSDQQ